METIKPLTDEQRAVVDAIVHQNKNAVVNAVAGSGKTRTALAAALEFLMRPDCKPYQRALLVVYNKRLQQDMFDQLRDSPIPVDIKKCVEVRTIHGLGHRYFGGRGLTSDKELFNWTGKCKPVVDLLDFAFVVIDEAQDLTPVLFSFLHYVMSFLSRPRLLILGDPFQLLYRFKGAKEEYLLDAASKFADVSADVPFCHFKLSICFRITHEMAAWINLNLNPNNLNRVKEPYTGWFADRKKRIEDWWGQGIRADPARPPSPGSLIYLDRMKQPRPQLKFVLNEIISIFKEYDDEHVALISPSIVSNDKSPVRLITNTLTMVNNVPQAWFFDTSKGIERNGDDTFTSETRRNKRLASTIHKFKGRERDAIVLVGLDSFPEKVEKRDPMNVFNMFYVGATRARKRLLIIQWSDIEYATHSARRSVLEGNDDVNSAWYPVPRALDFCPYNAILCEESKKCLTAHDFAEVRPCPLVRDDYVVPGTHCSNQYPTLENVLPIIDIALQIKLQLLLNDGKLELPSIGCLTGVPKSLSSFLIRVAENAAWKTVYDWAEILQIATALLTHSDRLYYRWRQIQDFDRWPVVEYSHKLDDSVRNLVHLLYVPLCGDKADERLSQVSAEVEFDEKLASLKQLWKEEQFKADLPIAFNMTRNVDFARLCGEELLGSSMVKLNFPLSGRMFARLWEKACTKKAWTKEEDLLKESERGGVADIVDIPDDVSVTVVLLRAAKDTSHDDLLQVGCYGAMWQEFFEKFTSSSNEQEPSGTSNHKTITVKTFVVYPSQGLLKQVELHMNSFEFLHRVGFRKLNMPFDERVLVKPEIPS